MCAVRGFADATSSRVTFEWALIAGVNDSKEQAEALGALLRRYGLGAGKSHVNVIPLNPTDGFVPDDVDVEGRGGGGDGGGRGGGGGGRDGNGTVGRHAVDLFCAALRRAGRVSVTPRMRRGIDINAGCGQLATQHARRAERRVRGTRGARGAGGGMNLAAGGS